jgi:hypothetical protein
MFSGSYHPDDVRFLLHVVSLEPTAVAEKERLIQSGQRHYSEMIGPEMPPSPEYLRIFHEALAREQGRFARDLLVLARILAHTYPQGPITLVSLARAGTPIGALLGRILRQQLQRAAVHYSISIIRDRGIDEVALRYILDRHPPHSIAFIDGWTGKGLIAGELERAIRRFNQGQGTQLNPGLFTVSDLCGMARASATTEDYLIPCSILGATISGLISRSILNDRVVGAGDFHGCIYYNEMKSQDLSGWFLDVMTREVEQQWQQEAATGPSHSCSALAPRTLPFSPQEERIRLRERSENLLVQIRREHGVRDSRHIKPGIGEATRVLLRRVPGCLLLRDLDRAEVAPLLHLARVKDVPVHLRADLPYLAVALIQEVER